VIIALFYMVPVLGLLTFGVLSVWGLGVAVTAAFGGMRKEMPEKTLPTPRISPPPTAPVAPVITPLMTGATPETSASVASFAPSPSAETQGQTATATLEEPLPPVVPALLAYPRAGFWERMGAAFLDVVLVSILGAIMGGPPWLFLVALAYFSGMWAWRGTTIGGIVLGLKVVRADSEPVTFTVALVRALAGAFSIVVLFLGFLWIAWDGDKQGWHDKIAGTLVLKLPKGTPLICL